MRTQNLFHEDVVADPYKYYGQIRDTDPVVWNDEAEVWLVTDYDSVSRVLRQPSTFSSQVFVRDKRPPSPPIRAIDAEDFQDVQDFFSRTMSALDHPEHTTIRRALQGPFTVRALERYRGVIAEEVDHLLGEAVIGGSQTEFVTSIAMPFPILVVARILGVPAEYGDDIRSFGAGFHAITRSEEDRMSTAAAGIRGFIELIRELINRKSMSPEDDLLSHMAGLVKDDVLSLDDAIANAALLLSAGHETTANLITNGLVNLLQRPHIWEMLPSADTSVLKDVVEECLRFDGPVISFLRIATVDTELGGKTIHEGDRVRWVMSSANRDPAHFDRPDEFRLGRKGAGHLSFGSGIHFCLGVNLARLEAQVFLKSLAADYPATRIETPLITYQKSVSFRAVERLDVALR